MRDPEDYTSEGIDWIFRPRLARMRPRGQSGCGARVFLACRCHGEGDGGVTLDTRELMGNTVSSCQAKPREWAASLNTTTTQLAHLGETRCESSFVITSSEASLFMNDAIFGLGRKVRMKYRRMMKRTFVESVLDGLFPSSSRWLLAATIDSADRVSPRQKRRPWSATASFLLIRQRE